MSWFTELAGKAENLLVNLDEHTGAVLRNQNVPKKHDCIRNVTQKKRPVTRIPKTVTTIRYQPSNRFVPHSKEQSPSRASPLPRVLKQSPSHCNKSQRNNTPRTMFIDVKDHDFIESYGYKPRRFSLPADIGEISDNIWVQRLEKLEAENSMLKNELNVTNRELRELVVRLHRTEAELVKTNNSLENTEIDLHKVKKDKESLSKQIDQLTNLTNADLNKHLEEKTELEMEISVLKQRNKDLEDLVKLFDKQDGEREDNHNKTENDLRHAQCTIDDLQNDLSKAREECKRLEKEWESYKLRVKNMLSSKDKEIKALQQGANLTEDTKMLVEIISNLKEEREELSVAVNRVRGECGDMKQCIEKLEIKHYAAERVVIALRDALREERAARSRAEASNNDLAKELKFRQMESGQVIANLQASLMEKENELSRMQESSISTSINNSNAALNVADFDTDDIRHTDEKIDYLSQKLVQKQKQIEMLMADNNILKIQLDKLETKYKTELRAEHSVVSLLDGHKQRSLHNAMSVTDKTSRWFGKLIRSHPLFRVFILLYMVCLHMWVFAVLLNNTPDNKNYSYYRKPMLNPN